MASTECVKGARSVSPQRKECAGCEPRPARPRDSGGITCSAPTAPNRLSFMFGARLLYTGSNLLCVRLGHAITAVWPGRVLVYCTRYGSHCSGFGCGTTSYYCTAAVKREMESALFLHESVELAVDIIPQCCGTRRHQREHALPCGTDSSSRTADNSATVVDGECGIAPTEPEILGARQKLAQTME